MPGPPSKEHILHMCSLFLTWSGTFFRFKNVRNSSNLNRNYKIRPQAHSQKLDSGKVLERGY